jgi:putative phosphoesterase
VIIGIVSDTHDQLDCIDRILDHFARHEVDHILHGGDFVAPFSVKRLKRAGCPITAVFGNNDGERLGLRKAFKDMGEVHERMVKLELAGRRIALMHEPDFVEELAASGAFDVIVYGHTHGAEVRRVNETLVINPGGGGGVPDGNPTCCVLDLATLKATIDPI